MAVQHIPADAFGLEERVAASARLLEHMAQTCAVLRASCLEQAHVLRALSLDARALIHIQRAERHLAAWQAPYLQQPSPATRLVDGG